MSDIKINTTLKPCVDDKILNLKEKFFNEPQKNPDRNSFIDFSHEWFMSTKLNNITGIELFANKDITIGCTQYIESICLKYSWNIQVLPEEYGYYNLMGKSYTQPGELLPNVPLIVSVPNWKHGHRPYWQEILKECEEKNIDIHVDGAWFTVAKDISIDLTHPAIKSFAMSLSKYIGSWNRIGLRWCRQRSLDTITMFNVQNKYNEALTSCGYFIMNNLERDYGWNTYGAKYNQLCKEHKLDSSNFFYVAKKDNVPVSISDMLLSK